MAVSKKDVISKFLHVSAIKDKNGTEQCLKNLQELSVNEGLSDAEIQELVQVITSNKLASALVVKLFYCLVPEKFVSCDALKNLLSWFFTEVNTGRISKSSEKQFIHWITGIVHFELGDVKIIESYFHSFLFLLRRDHMESVVSKLLCLLLKPEDAKRWTVKKILEIQRKNGPKAHTNCILSILKSYRPDVVPENVPMIRMNYENSTFHDNFRRAHERKIQSAGYNPSSSLEITWNQFKPYDKRTGNLQRLIPTVEEVNLDGRNTRTTTRKFSVMDSKNMAALGLHCLRIGIPAQTMSLLSNVAGFHVLAFSDPITKSRFSYKLRHTLFRVFILELEPYSVAEKTVFLDSLIGLQEYMQQGLPVVTEFLLHYLLIWDGLEFREQIFSLIQWVMIKNEKDWQECFFRPLRQIFRSSGLHTKYLVLEAMGSLLRNVIAFLARKEHLFVDDCSECDGAKVVEDVVNFASELIAEGIIWSDRAGRREMLSAALGFYEMCSVIEYSDEFPVVLVPPPALVYGCLFSGSRVTIARFCSLLIRFWQNTMERLLSSGRTEDFFVEVKKTYIYMVDFYRCLWSNTDFQQSRDSFMFQHKAFSELFWEFQNSFGVNVKNIFAVDRNFAFWDDLKAPGNALADEYPSIVNLKLLCEDHVF